MSKLLFSKQKGRLFEPKFTRSSKMSSTLLASQYKNDAADTFFKNTNIESSSSFRYGNKDVLVSTQQLKVDYSKYENHTFFHSAVAKVNEAFDKIVNFYPFEKPRKEIEKYEDDLTGFEKYVLDMFPKNLGYLVFSGTVPGESFENGTQINVLDRSGASISQISDTPTGEPVLDPNYSPFFVEMFLHLPDIPNENQIILQKINSLANNITLSIENETSTSNCNLQFSISSGSVYTFVTGSLSKGEFNHIAAFYDPFSEKTTGLVINDDVFYDTNKVSLGALNYNAANLTIGTGESARVNNSIFTPTQTLSGSIDELRIFHNSFDVDTIKKRRRKTYYAEEGDNLKLFFRFNEPSGEYEGNNIVIDASGNSLHSVIENYHSDHSRENTLDIPIESENINRSPVLFPTYSDVITLNSRLLETAALYDEYNPNLITKLIPQHYFQEGTNYRDYSKELENLDATFSNFSSGDIGKNKSEIPGIQLLMKLLFAYAKFFDELKLYIDAVTSFRFTSYDDYDTTPDPLLIKKAKKLNVKLPSLFTQGDIEQVLDGVDLTSTGGLSAINLNQIQNLIWRRILSEAPRINQARGTVRSIKSVFRNAGIEPDNILTFREYGGSKEKSLDTSKELKKDVFPFIDFSKDRSTSTGLNWQGYPIDGNIPRLKSGFLSGSRVEPGLPLIAGTYVNHSDEFPNGISDNESDGLFTSGSFTYEALYRWEQSYRSPESLIRMHVTGTLSPSEKEGCVLNLVATDNDLTLYFRDDATIGTSIPLKSMSIDDINIFDNDVWYISFGKKDGYELSTQNTSSYFLRASKQVNGDITVQREKEIYFADPDNSVFKLKSEMNTSGSFLVIGSQSIQPQATSYDHFLNDSSLNSDVRTSEFTGLISSMKFYSKNTEKDEFLNRSRNYDSHGVKNPFINYNFSQNTSGSFSRLILQTDPKQATQESDSNGDILIFDFTQNDNHFLGSNFSPEINVTKNVRVNFEKLSDKFDLNYTKEKIRIRSYEDPENIETGHFATIGPVSEVLPSEENVDDNRLSIDMSVMKGLNDNILRIFSDFSSIETAIGRPNNIFEDNYVDLKSMREIYFNNVIEELDLVKYREIFKWIDNSFTDTVYSLLPRTTNFLGINFIYESHVLERNRFRYLSDEIYMASRERTDNRSDILLSQYVAKIKRH